MNADQPNDVTALLGQWRAGSSEAQARVMEAVQRELRRLASSYMRRERSGHTLQPTALMNEAYMKLVGQRSVTWESRAHFYGIAAQIMRRILVDHARRRSAAKRDGMDGDPVSLSGVADPIGGENVDVLSLHEALTDLAALDRRQAEIVELRFFGGLTVEDIAGAQGVSPATVKRELTTAKLWLRRRMQQR